jgi:hypothetical protein
MYEQANAQSQAVTSGSTAAIVPSFEHMGGPGSSSTVRSASHFKFTTVLLVVDYTSDM